MEEEKQNAPVVVQPTLPVSQQPQSDANSNSPRSQGSHNSKKSSKQDDQEKQKSPAQENNPERDSQQKEVQAKNVQSNGVKPGQSTSAAEFQGNPSQAINRTHSIYNGAPVRQNPMPQNYQAQQDQRQPMGQRMPQQPHAALQRNASILSSHGQYQRPNQWQQGHSQYNSGNYNQSMMRGGQNNMQYDRQDHRLQNHSDHQSEASRGGSTAPGSEFNMYDQSSRSRGIHQGQNIPAYQNTMDSRHQYGQQPQQARPTVTPMETPKLQNIVSTANLSTKIDLHRLAMYGRNVEYNQKRFAAAIIRIRDPKTTALVFQSGKMVCTGAKSEEESKTAAKQYSKQIKKTLDNKSVKMKEFKIQNIVASVDAGFKIHLEELKNHTQQQKMQTTVGNKNKKKPTSSYEPEVFPGLIFRMMQPKVVLLIFMSGKIVLTGAKTREEIDLAYQQIHGVLKKHENTLASDKEHTLMSPNGGGRR